MCSQRNNGSTVQVHLSGVMGIDTFCMHECMSAHTNQLAMIDENAGQIICDCQHTQTH